MSKSALFAVGAPHTWPGLLAALAWLVEMLSYEEKAAAARAASFDDRARRPCKHRRSNERANCLSCRDGLLGRSAKHFMHVLTFKCRADRLDLPTED